MSSSKIESPPDSPPKKSSPLAMGTGGVLGIAVKIVLLGLVLGVVIALTPGLVGDHQWVFLAIIWLIAVILVLTYAGKDKLLPAKYLVPGVLMLTLFVVYPIFLTAKTSFTNYGDGTRTTKEETVATITNNSVVQTPDAPRYNLTVGTTGSVTTGPFEFFLVDTSDPTKLYKGDLDGLEELSADDVTVTEGYIRAADGYTILNARQINAANTEIQKVTVPVDSTSAIIRQGISQAFQGTKTLVYDAKSDTITNTTTNDVYKVTRQGDRSYFVDSAGKRASDQSWQQNVGLLNYKTVFTNSQISKDFLAIFLWTLLFAILSVVTNFALGLLLAVTLNEERMRGQKIYRALLIMPYAIPGFISLLLWSSFFNKDFGLINDLTGLSVDWFGHVWTARFAVVLTNLWMGFPYMFLVCTGALQAIPTELREAAKIDGASGWKHLTRIVFPLLLVTVAPLLVSTFAYNFNNYGAIYLLTKGGPFPVDNPTAGGTDILISYTIRLAFGAGGAQIGFASAISVLLFVITGIIAAMQFRVTRRLEDVN